MNPPRRITDNDRLWAALAQVRGDGLHTFDIRREMRIANPSQRVAELEGIHNVNIPRRSEVRGGRRGTRYFHPSHAPARAGGRPAFPRAGTAAGRARSGLELVLNYVDPARPWEKVRPRSTVPDRIPEVSEDEARALFVSHTDLPAAA